MRWWFLVVCVWFCLWWRLGCSGWWWFVDWVFCVGWWVGWLLCVVLILLYVVLDVVWVCVDWELGFLCVDICWWRGWVICWDGDCVFWVWLCWCSFRLRMLLILVWCCFNWLVWFGVCCLVFVRIMYCWCLCLYGRVWLCWVVNGGIVWCCFVVWLLVVCWCRGGWGRCDWWCVLVLDVDIVEGILLGGWFVWWVVVFLGVGGVWLVCLGWVGNCVLYWCWGGLICVCLIVVLDLRLVCGSVWVVWVEVGLCILGNVVWWCFGYRGCVWWWGCW